MTNLSSFIYPEETDKLNKTPVEDTELKQVDMEECLTKGVTMVNVDVANDDSNIIQTTTESTDVERNTTAEEKTESHYERDDTYIMQDTIMMTVEGDLIAKQEPPEKGEPTIDLTAMKPGEQLRYLREQKGFSAQQIADRLYLSLHIIQGIEADDYQHLPPSIFVRGYFRNYAKLLEIPVEPLLNAYTNLTGSKSLPPLTPQMKQKEQSKSSDSWVKAVTFMIIIVSMALMALWRIYPNINESGGDEIKEPAELGEAVALPLQPFTPIALSEQPTDVNGDFMPPLEGTTEGDDATGILPLVGIPVDPTKIGEQAGGQPATETTPKTPVAPVDPRSMILHYQYESWTRVVDKNDKKIYEGIPKAGESILVKGEPPFKARFGVMEGISVEYKGTKTPLTDYHSLNGRSVSIGEAVE